MPSVFVGQDCKYDRNFEALPVKRIFDPGMRSNEIVI